MKVLESQVAIISNFEVYQQIFDIRAQYKAWNKVNSKKLPLPENLFNLQTEILDYLKTKPSPLREQDQKRHYNEDVYLQLLEKLLEENLRQKLTKGEAICIFNIRPSSTATLNGIIEDMSNRFSEEEQNRIVEIVAEVLGHDDPEVEGEEEAEGDDAGEEEGDEGAVENVN
ncbi:RNA polymerase Rpb4-domain-containing protein [Cladorrhinum sp. PSN332]|nr:RNA polymerase Rpb4-domain-containing protein [Cladorrhinum sp. PSN332]